MLVGLTLASIPASDRKDAVSLSLIENRKQLGLEIGPSERRLHRRRDLARPAGPIWDSPWSLPRLRKAAWRATFCLSPCARLRDHPVPLSKSQRLSRRLVLGRLSAAANWASALSFRFSATRTGIIARVASRYAVPASSLA